MAVVEFRGFSQMYRKLLFEVRFINSLYAKIFIAKFNKRLDKNTRFIKAHGTKESDILVRVTFPPEISTYMVERIINESIRTM
ncbi:hypothetical protein PDN30_26255 [Bacillus cereus]|nr:hypothetical protein [Bacillus cereus]